MKLKAITAFGLGLSLLLTTSSALAQSSPDAMPAESPTPGETTTPEAAPEPEAAPAEETTTPESTTTPDSSSPDSSVGAADSGETKLVACGPNGAASIVMEVRPGCHELKVNSPPRVE
ncbi:MAG: hypothetical protein HC851_12510 [Acaryochloris sp. RU_4_1]|nr:hypothetical protein [Acaryochloris sp. RU_4_1]NJR55018.1 hypothetical protein [Acaryochloris sp. CRU_2_0]